MSIDAYLIEYPGAGATSITDDAAIAARAEKDGATVKRIRGDSTPIGRMGVVLSVPMVTYSQSSPKTWPLRDQAIRREALEEAAKLCDDESTYQADDPGAGFAELIRGLIDQAPSTLQERTPSTPQRK